MQNIAAWHRGIMPEHAHNVPYNFHYDFWCENCNNQLYSKCNCDFNNKLITKKTILNPYGPNYIIDNFTKNKIQIKFTDCNKMK